jgi:hypothetical protein
MNMLLMLHEGNTHRAVQVDNGLDCLLQLQPSLHVRQKTAVIAPMLCCLPREPKHKLALLRCSVMLQHSCTSRTYKAAI